MVNTTPSFWDQENKGQDWGQPGTVDQHSRKEAEILALVRPGEAGSLPQPQFTQPQTHDPASMSQSWGSLLLSTMCTWLLFPAGLGAGRSEMLLRKLWRAQGQPPGHVALAGMQGPATRRARAWCKPLCPTVTV